VSRPASGHLYFDLKDDRSVIAAISWKGQAQRMQVQPEEGMEVVATGRMTTFPGQSKYQLIVDDVAPAGAGALMAMLEKRKAALQAEGLFDPARKKPIPYLPSVIGVVTSPSGAVIRDILHRLRDRFPRHVLVWPVAVQGQDCAAQVAAAIKGFNALPESGPIPRPDVLIVARGGGSLEDLWGFNEEVVVRTAAASMIPLISAVGHETDTTLIDHAADWRAPTPTAAAELAVPVRLELLATLDALGARLTRGVGQGLVQRGQRLRDLARALPRVETLVATPRQRLDAGSQRLASGLGLAVARKHRDFDRVAGRLQPLLLRAGLARQRDLLAARDDRLARALRARMERRGERLSDLAARLAPALARLTGEAGRKTSDGRQALSRVAERLDALDRIRVTLGYRETLKRGYAVVRGDGAVVTSKAGAETASALEIEFRDGRLALGGRAGKRPKGDGETGQGSLF
jgi:exodeoxyribonuclease VII large subunit